MEISFRKNGIRLIGLTLDGRLRENSGAARAGSAAPINPDKNFDLEYAEIIHRDKEKSPQ
jgi:hypothetical protein